jgi:ZIP family zinc transporter
VSLRIGALIGLYDGTSHRMISLVMAVGAGVLISSVALLVDEAYKAGGFYAASIDLLLEVLA